MKKKIISLLLVLAFLFMPLTVNAITIEEFIDQHKDEVVQIAKEKDIFASIMMAQAILESGSGNSDLAKYYNNYFGMKGYGVTLPTVEYGNIATTASFQVFGSATDSFRAYAENFYKNDKVYGKFLAAQDPFDAAEALNGVYATDSNYSSQLISLMNTYNLYELDQRVLDLIKDDEEKTKELEKRDRLLLSYKNTSSMVKAKTASIARRLYKQELKELNRNNILSENIELDKYLGAYYTVEDIARLYNRSLTEAKILFNNYKKESIEAVYSGNTDPENKVRSLSFNKYLAQLITNLKANK